MSQPPKQPPRLVRKPAAAPRRAVPIDAELERIRLRQRNLERQVADLRLGQGGSTEEQPVSRKKAKSSTPEKKL